METRKCKYCNSVIPADKRADTKFCSNSCKANYWEENKTKKKTPEIKSANEKDAPKVTGLPLEGLRGVIENKPQIAVIDVKQTSDTSEKPSEIRIETQAYKDAFAKVKDSESIIQRINNNLTECEQNLSEWEQEIQRLHRSLPKKRYEPTNIDSAALMDRLEDEYLYDDEYKKRQISAQLKEVQSKLNVNAECKSKLEKALPIVQKRYSDAMQNLKSIPQYEVKKNLLNIPNLGNPIKNIPVLAVKEPSTFITISQSTKDGKMRGSQEIIHDTDIAVKVEDGIAMTTKNRYHPRGTEFRVFPTSGKSVSKVMDEPRNII